MPIGEFLQNTLKDVFAANRMKNLFGGQPQPDTDIVGSSQQSRNPLLEEFLRRDGHGDPGMSSRQPDTPMVNPAGDTSMSAPADRSVLDRFSDTVFNPPERDPVTSKRNLFRMAGTGILSGLQGTTPGQRMPTYDAAGKVVGTRPKGFWESFGEDAFNVPEAEKIMNAPHEARVADWKNKVDAQKAAATLENTALNNESLAAKRGAETVAIPQKVAIAQQEQQRKMYLASLQTLTDAEKIDLLQQGKIDIQDIKDANAMGRVVTQQTGAMDRVTAQQTGAMDRTVAQQTGANERVGAQQAGATERAGMGGAAIGTIPGPDGQPVGVWYNPRTQKMEKISLDGQGIGGVTKPGTPDKGTAGASGGDAKLEAVRTRTQETIDALNDLVDKKGKLKPEIAGAVGGSRLFGLRTSPYAAGTTTRSAEVKINHIKANLLVNLFAEMKAQSRTGATGWGQLAVKEMEKMEAAASKLDPTVTEEEFEAEIKRLQDKLNLIMKDAPTAKPATPATPGAAVALPPVAQRKVGQKYKMSDGSEATWNGPGRGFN